MTCYEPRVTGTKICSKCEEEKNVLAFAVDKRHTDGLQSECRDCQNEYQEQYRKVQRSNRVGDKTYKNIYGEF